MLLNSLQRKSSDQPSLDFVRPSRPSFVAKGRRQCLCTDTVSLLRLLVVLGVVANAAEWLISWSFVEPLLHYHTLGACFGAGQSAGALVARFRCSYFACPERLAVSRVSSDYCSNHWSFLHYLLRMTILPFSGCIPAILACGSFSDFVVVEAFCTTVKIEDIIAKPGTNQELCLAHRSLALKEMLPCSLWELLSMMVRRSEGDVRPRTSAGEKLVLMCGAVQASPLLPVSPVIDTNVLTATSS